MICLLSVLLIAESKSILQTLRYQETRDLPDGHGQQLRRPILGAGHSLDKSVPSLDTFDNEENLYRILCVFAGMNSSLKQIMSVFGLRVRREGPTLIGWLLLL